MRRLARGLVRARPLVSAAGLEQRAVRLLKSQPPPAEAEALREALAADPRAGLRQARQQWARVESDLAFVAQRRVLERVLADSPPGQALLLADLFSQRMAEISDHVRVESLLDYAALLGQHRLEDSRVLDLLEGKVFDQPVELVAGPGALGRMTRLVRLCAAARNPRSELMHEVARWARVMSRENILSLPQLARLTRALLQTGGCHGLSAVVEAQLDLRRLPFKELVRLLGVVVPLRLFPKETMLRVEAHLCRYLRHYLNERIDVKLLVRPNFEQELRISLADACALFEGFSATGCFGASLRDRLLNLMAQSLPSLSNEQFVQAVVAFVRGSYECAGASALYRGIEEQAALRCATLSLKASVELLRALANYGRLSLPVLGKLCARLPKEAGGALSPTHVIYLLEAFASLRSYFVPSALIEDPEWRQQVPEVIAHCRAAFEALLEQRVRPWLADYRSPRFNPFQLSRTVALCFSVAAIFHVPRPLARSVEPALDHHDSDYAAFKNSRRKLLDESLPEERQPTAAHRLFTGLVRKQPLEIDHYVVLANCCFKSGSEVVDLQMAADYIVAGQLHISKAQFPSALKVLAALRPQQLTRHVIELLLNYREFGQFKDFFGHREYVAIVWCVLCALLADTPAAERFAAQLRGEALLPPGGWRDAGVRPRPQELVRIRTRLLEVIGIGEEAVLADLLGIDLDQFDRETFSMYRQVMLFFLSCGKMRKFPLLLEKFAGLKQAALFRIVEARPGEQPSRAKMTALMQKLAQRSESLPDTNRITLIRDFSDECFNFFPLALVDKRKPRRFRKLAFAFFNTHAVDALSNCSLFNDVAFLGSSLDWDFFFIRSDTEFDVAAVADHVIDFLK